MESLDFEDATKEAVKARICLTGPSGSGKTYTALMLAFGLGENVAVIDTERRSVSKYVGRNGWRFKTMTPTKFSPLSLVDHLGKAAGHGCDVVIIDSWSHYWQGVDGMLEQVDRRTALGNSNNKFGSGWKEMGPEEQRMLDAILAYPGHVIVTLRVKTEYVVETNDRGKQQPRKLGLKPIQRDGFDYEFDFVGDMDLSNTLTVSKSRIEGVAAGAVYPKPGIELAKEIDVFLSEGEPLPTVADYRRLAAAAGSVEELKALFEEATSNQLAGAPMLDDNGRPTVLGDYLRAMATVVRNHQPVKAETAAAEAGVA